MCTGGNLVVDFFLHSTITVWVTYHDLLVVTNTLFHDNEFSAIITVL